MKKHCASIFRISFITASIAVLTACGGGGVNKELDNIPKPTTNYNNNPTPNINPPYQPSQPTPVVTATPLGSAKLAACMNNHSTAAGQIVYSKFMDCIADIYKGVEVGTGQTCSLDFRGLEQNNQYTISGNQGTQRFFWPAGFYQKANSNLTNTIDAKFHTLVNGSYDQSYLIAKATFMDKKGMFERDEFYEVFFYFQGKDRQQHLTSYGKGNFIRVKKSEIKILSGEITPLAESYCKISRLP